jgi:nucleotide-binding universal stress UspA family protein
MEKLQKILVPTDFSTCSEAALERAAELAKSFGATIDLLHVWEAPAYIAPEAMVGAAGGSQTLADLVKHEAESEMKKFVAGAQKKGIAIHDARIEHGPPARVVVEEAKRGDYDMIAVGTHGRTGLPHLLLGSVAEKIVRRADRPVLTVREAKAAAVRAG